MSDDDTGRTKKRRVQRACKVCRRKKIKCDAEDGNECSHCEEYGYKCSSDRFAKKMSAMDKAYSEELEKKVKKLEGLLQQFMSKSEIAKALSVNVNSMSDTSFPSFNSACQVKVGGNTAAESNEDKLFADDFTHMKLADDLNKLAHEAPTFRYWGVSTGIQLVKAAHDLKYGQGRSIASVVGKREPFWSLQPWEIERKYLRGIGGLAIYEFPEDDLLHDLIDIYFNRIEILLPLLHRPSFQQSIACGEHIRNPAFGGVVLLVCACASQHSDDPRVFLEVEDNKSLSSGWKWFNQVQLINWTTSTPDLHDLQLFALFAHYMIGSSSPQLGWTVTGLGLRMAQDIGAHRKQNVVKTIKSELRCRAFWHLVFADRIGSLMLGRSCALYDEDIDVEFPVEVDDEYWENSDPSQAFHQPPGRPSRGVYHSSLLKLNLIMAACLRVIYATTKSTIIRNALIPKRHHESVVDLDSALNAWFDSIPEHLRWEPNREDMILIHRPFIPSPGSTSSASFPSLAICTNAARCCSHVIDIVSHRGWVLPVTGMPAFTAALVLLLNVRCGTSAPTFESKAAEDIEKCMNWLRKLETRWHYAGRLWDMLDALASVGEVRIPQSISRKRERTAPAGGSSSAVSSDPPLPRYNKELGQVIRQSSILQQPMINWNSSNPSHDLQQGGGGLAQDETFFEMLTSGSPFHSDDGIRLGVGVDQDMRTLDMWSNASTAFQTFDWDTYITNISDYASSIPPPDWTELGGRGDHN